MKPEARRYKVSIRKNQLASKAIKTIENVELQQLPQTLYALLSEYPGYCATVIHQPKTYKVCSKGIRTNLEKLGKV